MKFERLLSLKQGPSERTLTYLRLLGLTLTYLRLLGSERLLRFERLLSLSQVPSQRGYAGYLQPELNALHPPLLWLLVSECCCWELSYLLTLWFSQCCC